MRSATESQLLCRLRFAFQVLKELDQSRLLMSFYARVSLLFISLLADFKYSLVYCIMSSLVSKLYLYVSFRFLLPFGSNHAIATTLQPQSLPNQIFSRYPTLRYLATYVISSNSYLRNKHSELLHVVFGRSFVEHPKLIYHR